MKTILNTLGIILFISTFTSCSFNAIRGNGTIVNKEVPIEDYTAIRFSGGASLIYEQKADTAPYLRIETDENIFPLLIVKSENGTLSIRSNENIHPSKYIVYTNSTGLELLKISGSLKAHLKEKLITDEITIQASGSTTIEADHLECNSFTSSISGSGNITLAGKANKLNCSISGSGKLMAFPMVTDSVYCRVSGSGNFSVYATQYLNVSISGSGRVMYKGDPRIDQSISGSGKVVRAE